MATPPVSEIIAVSKALPGFAEAIHAELKLVTGRADIGFALVVFTQEQCQYVSNCDRKEVAAALQVLLANWAAGMPDKPAHEVH